ncbi:hypothetical protein HK103_002350 [Boothiomyces macroporosus]|uniref:Uncharacterized protein n=1 Tax=Boothiomyces macroporosus TaxID=261099 RepID=A0AAD5UJW7_9FUNG|nr:hypothetical protein HK103_002350 [Boothiomyces macroporosus]
MERETKNISDVQIDSGKVNGSTLELADASTCWKDGITVTDQQHSADIMEEQDYTNPITCPVPPITCPASPITCPTPPVIRPAPPIPPLINDLNKVTMSQFRTFRKDTISGFYDLLFPKSGKPKKVLMIKAPEFSGKSVIGHLLVERLLENRSRSVVYLRCYRLEENESVASLVFKTTGRRLTEVLEMKDCVLVMDEAECSYKDDYFWKTIVQESLKDDVYPGLRLVFLSSTGYCERFQINIMHDLPIDLPPQNIFGLETTPGLYLKYKEFEEMVAGTIFERAKDIIYLVCSNHIVVAIRVLDFLYDAFKNYPSTSLQEIQSALYSKNLLNYMGSWLAASKSCLSMVFSVQNLDKSTRLRIKSTFHKVAYGAVVNLKDDSLNEECRNDAKWLVKNGFLYENNEGELQFPSQMHLKVWLNSTREEE